MSKTTESCKQPSAFTHAHVGGPAHVAKEVDSALLGTSVTHQNSLQSLKPEFFPIPCSNDFR